MELVPYSDADLPLTEAIETDPEMMKELGGPVPKVEIPTIHERRLATTAGGVDWWLKIVPDASGEAAGTIGIWEKDWKGSTIHEIGWMVLPAYQGRGIASAALELILARARSEPRVERLHAFPAVTNAPSNALCRKFGFELTGQHEFDFRDRRLQCNCWELDVS